MKIKILHKIILLMLFLITIMSISVFANTLTLNVTTDKATYELNDKVVVTVDWTEKMQAASFTIKYDSDKLKFEATNIANTFYNTEKDDEVSINWASMEEIDFTKMTFTFKAAKTGEANISIKEVQAFADGNLVSPTSYDFTTLGNKNITINSIDKSQGNDNTIAPGIIPDTGLGKIILSATISLFVCGGIGFIKYRRLSGV